MRELLTRLREENKLALQQEWPVGAPPPATLGYRVGVAATLERLLRETP